MKRNILILLILIFSCIIPIVAQQNVLLKNDSLNLSYTNKGWQFRYKNDFMMQMQFRLQFRTQFNSQDYFFFVSDEDASNGSFNIQRARIKIGGFAYTDKLKYFLEYDFPSNNLLNWEFTYHFVPELKLKIGQWKIKYNTERFVSSGKQQMVERSISNRFFTFDRQIGIQVLGNIFNGSLFSSSYYFGIFNGNGRMQQNDDEKFLYFVRYQWNFAGKPIQMSFCDIQKITKPEGFLAISYVHNQSRYTMFSGSGGGELPGYTFVDNQQFIVEQLNFESMFKWKGFSLSGELHRKYINDIVNKKKSTLKGGYLMGGYFLNQIINFVPKNLELTLRFAQVSDRVNFTDIIKEYNVGVNYFFKNHLNKLSLDISYIDNMDFSSDEDIYKFRIQWDISF